jgi:hypothetical protein
MDDIQTIWKDGNDAWDKLDMDDIFAHTKLMTWNNMACIYE